MTRRPYISKAQQIAHARAQIATFRANENNPPVDYRTPEEKERAVAHLQPAFRAWIASLQLPD